MSTARRWFVPDTVQSSRMDCGPVALQGVLEGFGIHASLDRLRDACQTDVDGTSIDTLEEIANQAGLLAEQMMIPPDHLFVPAAQVLPALLVVTAASGQGHFIVLWRRMGKIVQVLDPSAGRRWIPTTRLLRSLHRHVARVPIETWFDWTRTAEFSDVLRARIAALGVPTTRANAWLQAIATTDDWRVPAAYDAAIRCAASLNAARATGGATEMVALIDRLVVAARDSNDATGQALLKRFASARAANERELAVEGAVLVRFRRPPPSSADSARDPSVSVDAIPASLQDALAAAPLQPARDLIRLMRTEPPYVRLVLVWAALVGSFGVVVEALIYRTIIGLDERFATPAIQIGALLAVLCFTAALAAIEWPTVTGLLRLGRHLEARLRLAFMSKLPRLSDRYLASRPPGDMAERSHQTHMVRAVPVLVGNVVRVAAETLLTVLAIVWLHPHGVWAGLVAAASIVVPLLALPVITECDLRARGQHGALSALKLDVLRGLMPIHAHRAAAAFRNEYESVLSAWVKARRAMLGWIVSVEAIQALATTAAASWLVMSYVNGGGQIAGVLLLAYWSLNLPGMGQTLARVVRMLPNARNSALRLVEPLSAPESSHVTAPTEPAASQRSGPRAGVELRFDRLTVQISGHTILDQVNLEIGAGQHVAIVGPSGAGKSTLLGVLLGWFTTRPDAVQVDGSALSAAQLAELRRVTAWVDPAIQIWNRTLFDNVHYGASATSGVDLTAIVEMARLRGVLESLPAGWLTSLGEGGGLVSGGEGQRVRFARALAKPEARLVLLDEPFRGLSRSDRTAMLQVAREHWRAATILCVTHDLAETQEFDHLVVIEAGDVRESGSPAKLAADPNSRYRSLLDAEQAVNEQVWGDPAWRRLRVAGGLVFDDSAPARRIEEPQR